MRNNKIIILAWLGWSVAAMTGLFQFLMQTSSSVMITDLERDFSLNSFSVSLLTSSYYVTYLIFQIPAGLWIDYFKPRRTIFICQLLLALFFFMFSQSHHFWVACVSRLLMGIVSAPTFVSAFYLIARTLPAKYFALMAGLTETLAMLGGLLGQALLARSVSAYGWRHSVVMMAAFAVLLGFSALIVMRDNLIQDHAHPLPAAKMSKKIQADLAQLFFKPQAWLNGIYCGLLFGIIGAFGGFWCVTFLMKLYNIPLKHAADTSAMIFIGAAIGTPLIGWLSEKMGSKRILMIVSAVCATGLLIKMLYFPPQQLFWMSCMIALLGFSSAAYVLPFAVIRDITSPHMRGTAMGYINMMCILIGAPLMLPLIGALIHWQIGNDLLTYQRALIVVPLCSSIGALLAFFVKEKQPD